MKRTQLLRKTALRRTTPLTTRRVLAKLSKNPVADIKRNIQSLLRQHAIARDGGCVLRHYEETGACGGRRQDGQLILQAEHLITRKNSISFGDMRNVVCLCQHHHGHFKPQHSRLYWELIERHIGAERWAWLKRVEADRRPYRFTAYDWMKVEAALKGEHTEISAAVLA